ncbi:MAG: hypothetical protein HY372_03465 [Candidatus Andersenbacteria bacterium]|nr:hypothetical protein [Candidatus Andersenbacteria bacterium]
MLDFVLLTKIWLVGFGLNIIWEFAHCQLYETCRRQPWRRLVPLLVPMAGKDGLIIVMFYMAAAWLWRSAVIVDSVPALIFFVVISLGFAFIDETISLRWKRWGYAAAMPTIGGVGLTPLLEIALTGLATLLIIFGLPGSNGV